MDNTSVGLLALLTYLIGPYLVLAIWRLVRR